jgi:hypothetical protein
MRARARPESRMSRAIAKPSPPRTSGSHSIRRPARRRAFLAQVVGCGRGSFSSTRITSRASSTGPMPLPMGWRPSVMTTSSDSFMRCATYSNRRRRRCASGMERTLAVGPMGMSSTRWVDPAAIFLDRMDATICPGESMFTGALDRDQHVVGRARGRPCRPRPGSRGASRTMFQQGKRQFHIGQHLHGVGRAGGRGDGARRGLGAQHAMRRHDGHDQHGGAVAGNAADAVFVHHQGLMPVQPLAAGTMASDRKNTSSRSSSSRLQATTKAVSSILE